MQELVPQLLTASSLTRFEAQTAIPVPKQHKSLPVSVSQFIAAYTRQPSEEGI